jgi:hypothetical protein
MLRFLILSILVSLALAAEKHPYSEQLAAKLVSLSTASYQVNDGTHAPDTCPTCYQGY